MVTPKLFSAYPSAEAMAEATHEDIFPYIRSISYPNNKAKFLDKTSKMLVDKFKGKVPADVNELQTLQGVGRKTANVVASVLYDIPTMPVDTHVFRVSERIGLTQNAKNPLQSEKQLVKYFPKDKLNIAHHWLILHGRYTCLARKPKCDKCSLTSFCKFFDKQKKSVNK
jgi:endonuclease-3